MTVLISGLMMLTALSTAAANSEQNAGQAHATAQLDRLAQLGKQRPGGALASKPFLVPEWAESGRDRKIGYTSMVRVSAEVKIYYNLWWHNQRWYAILPPDSVTDPTLEEGFSTNQGVVRTPIDNVDAFTRNIRFSVLSGNTFLVDFPFQSFYDSLEHWAELMVPSYSVLRDGEWAKHSRSSSKSVQRVVMPNMNRHVSSWFQRVFHLALGPGKAADPTFMLDYATMDRYDKLGWLLFENLVVVQDRYTHPQRKIGFAGTDHGDLWRYDGCDRYVSHDFAIRFFRPEYGRDFRAAAYEAAGLQPPQPWAQDGSPPPELHPQITFLVDGGSKSAQITNADEVFSMLQEVAQEFGMKARKVVLSNDAPFDSHLETMAQSAVVVGRHSNLMTSTMFLRPGAMAFEILPFKWEWHNISKMFVNITSSIGDIHHFAWRAQDVKFCSYKEANNIRYKDWYPDECHARECLQVHAKADVIVDVPEVRRQLTSKLTGIRTGKGVQELWEPWPKAV